MEECIKDPGGLKNTDPGGGWDNVEEPGTGWKVISDPGGGGI